MPRPDSKPTAREILAKNLRRLRVERGLSQEAVAELASLHRTYVGCLERSEKSASLDSIERLANALSVTITDLLTGKE